ncbi:hypothetical protein ACFX15_017954 [Malus domestica]
MQIAAEVVLGVSPMEGEESVFIDLYTKDPAENTGSGGEGKGAAAGKASSAFKFDPSFLIDPSCIKIGSVLGEGRGAIVYEGLYQSKPVAVKIIRPPKTKYVSLDRQEKFHREVSMLSKVKHDNIVKFVGACFEPSMIILTELLRGGNLQKYLWERRPGTPDLKCSISFAMDVCRAMEYLHANGIIHRDLKPANLLLTEDLNMIKVADFGHAREEISGAMTSEAGTYRWMAPELFSTEPVPKGSKKEYDHKADVYSFSIVLWELIINQTPFSGRTNIIVAYAAANKIRPELDYIPQDLIPLLESCWADDPKIRPEFMEITSHLSNYHKQLCAAELEPPAVNVPESEPQESNVKEEEPPRVHAIDKSEKKKKVKRRKKCRSSFFFFCCRPVAVHE